MAKSKGATLTRGKAATAEVVEPENPTVTLVRTDASAIVQWSANILQFLQGATELELAAKARLVRVEGLKEPKNGAEDAQIQDLVRLCNAGKKETADYWYITKVFDKMHSWATTGRKRGVESDDLAASIGNRLHASYVEAERRRAREEEDRLRREAEDRARQEREAELALLEQQALKAEASNPDLSDREAEFVRLYTSVSGSTAANGPYSARLAGFKNPDQTAMRLLGMPKIRKALEVADAAIKLRQQAVAVKSAPVLVEDVEVRPDIQKGGDRTTYSADVFDPIAYREAIISGTYNLDHALLVYDQVAANKLAQSLREQVNRIPGIRLRKTTRVV